MPYSSRHNSLHAPGRPQGNPASPDQETSFGSGYGVPASIGPRSTRSVSTTV